MMELSNQRMFGDSADKSSTQTWVIGDCDFIIRTEPWPEIDMCRDDLLLLISPLIPQLEPVMALEAVLVFFIVEAFLPSQD
jgi:hypothetical protein